MVSMLQETKDLFVPVDRIKMYLALTGEPTSLLSAIWRRRLATIKTLLKLFAGITNPAGVTTEAEEDQALALLLGAKSAGELLFLVRSLQWEELDSKLDELDLDQVAQRLVILLNRRDYIVHHFLERFLTDRYPFENITFAEIEDCVTVVFAQLSTEGIEALINTLWNARQLTLDKVCEMALRSFPTHAREFKQVLDRIRTLTNVRRDELDQLGWEVHYTDLICRQMERAEVHLILQTLPELVDPDLPSRRRVAFFEMLRRYSPEITAMEKVVNVVGSTAQKGDMKLFVDALTTFLNNFTADPPTPALIQTIASFFGSLADTVNELRVATLNAADTIANSLTFGRIFGEVEDDEARAVTQELLAADALVHIATPMKLTLIQRMLDGFTDDDDEQSILHILGQTKNHPEKHSTAAFLQLVAGVGYEPLDFSIDGSEHDEFMNLLAQI